MTVGLLELRIELRDAEPPKVPLETPEISVAAVDRPPFGNCGAQKRTKGHTRVGELDKTFASKIVEVASKRRERRNDPKYVGMGKRPPDLQRSAGSVDLSDRRSHRRQLSLESAAAVYAVDHCPQRERETAARRDEWEQPLLERHTGDVRQRHR